jgi:ssDNA-binding Zn-finger/Zn-ribbon topoisomerase 1
MARVGEEFPLECPNCGGDIRLIAFRLFYQCETIPGLRTVGNLRLLRTSCPRAGADPENPDASWRTARAATGVARSWPAHRQPLIDYTACIDE